MSQLVVKDKQKLTYNDVKIYVIYHKPATLIKNKILTPIHTGRNEVKNYTKGEIISDQAEKWLRDNMIGDDTGDSIAYKHRFYSEFSVMYWAWKNPNLYGNPKYVGFFHYRRQLDFDVSNTNTGSKNIYSINNEILNNNLKEDNILSTIDNVDVLVGNPFEPGVSIEKQFLQCIRTHKTELLAQALKFIEQKYPKMLKSAKEYLNDNKLIRFNIFVMKRELFREYCEFVFSILFELEKKLNLNKLTNTNIRALGYIGERLLGVFVTYLKNTRKDIVIAQRPILTEGNPEIPFYLEPFNGNNNIPVVYSCDDRNVKYLAPSINSLIKNASLNNNYDIIVLHRDIKSDNIKKLEVLVSPFKNISLRFFNINTVISYREWKFLDSCKENERYSEIFTFFIPRALKNYDKVISLDYKTLIVTDIAKLYHADLNSNPILASLDLVSLSNVNYPAQKIPYKADWCNYLKTTLKLTKLEDYYNIKVCVLNLKLLRDEGFTNKCLQRFNEIKEPREFAQDIINSLYTEQIQQLDIKWNVDCHLPISSNEIYSLFIPEGVYQEYIDSRDNPFIFTYCKTYNPWKSPNLPLTNYFWEYARTTPFYEEILQENICQDKFAASAEKANSLETTLEIRLKQIESAIEEIKKNPEFPLMKAIEQHVANITKMVDEFNAKSKS